MRESTVLSDTDALPAYTCLSCVAANQVFLLPPIIESAPANSVRDKKHGSSVRRFVPLACALFAMPSSST